MPQKPTSPMRRRKGVVDVIIAQRRHPLREFGVVLLLTRMKACVLEYSDIARQHRLDRPLGFGSFAIFNEAD